MKNILTKGIKVFGVTLFDTEWFIEFYIYTILYCIISFITDLLF